MPTGLIRTLSVLLPLLFLTGCAPLSSDEPPEPAAGCTTAPRQPKTTAELLVGKWRLTAKNYPSLPPDCVITLEFTQDGQVTIERIFPGRPIVLPATYTVTGNTLTLNGPIEDGPITTRDLTILAISETEIVLADRGKEANEQDHNFYARVESK